MIKLISVVASSIFLSMPVNAKDAYTFGRAPQLSSDIIIKTWKPFTDYLRAVTGKNIKLKVYGVRDDFDEDIRKGRLDFFYGNPGYMVFAKEQHGYIPLVKSRKNKLKGIIVVRNDSGITSAEQLAGKTIALPGMNAFAASRYLRLQLDDKLNIKYKPVYLSTHDNVYRSVVIGKYAAGGGVYRTYSREPETLRSQLKVIYETPGVAPHPVAAHPAVPRKLQNLIQKAILDLSSTPEGKMILQNINLLNPVKADYKRDYAPASNEVRKVYGYLYQ